MHGLHTKKPHLEWDIFVNYKTKNEETKTLARDSSKKKKIKVNLVDKPSKWEALVRESSRKNKLKATPADKPHKKQKLIPASSPNPQPENTISSLMKNPRRSSSQLDKLANAAYSTIEEVKVIASKSPDKRKGKINKELRAQRWNQKKQHAPQK